MASSFSARVRTTSEENFEMRAGLEALAAELAARTITGEELVRLDALLVEMRAAIRSDPAYHDRVLNPRFHAIINGTARRPRLMTMVESLRAQAATYQALLVNTDVTAEYIAAVEAEHDEIVAALRARAPKRAARAVAAHIDQACDEILRAMPSRG